MSTPVEIEQTERANARRSVKTGRLLERIGVGGIAVTLLATIAGWILVDGIVASIEDSLTLTDEAIVAISDTIDVAEDALSATGGGLEAVGAAVVDLEGALATTASVLEEADVVLSTTVPAGIDAAREPLPGLIRSSEVLSNVLNSLSLLGVDFRPDPPPAESLRAIDRELADLAERLRDPDASLARIGDEFDTVTGDLEGIALRLAGLSAAVSRAQAILAGYEVTTDRAADLVVVATADLATRRWVARLLMVLVGAVVAGSQAALVVLGRHVRTSTVIAAGIDRRGFHDPAAG